MKRRTPVTYETVRRMAAALQNVEEGTSYGTPALKVKGKLFARLREFSKVHAEALSDLLRVAHCAASPKRRIKPA